MTASSWRQEGGRHAGAVFEWTASKRCRADRHQPCTIGVGAVGDSLLLLRQPGSSGKQGKERAGTTGSGEAAPEPCVLTVKAGTSPALLVSCAVGVALLLRGGRWARHRVAVSLIRFFLVVGPMLSALMGAIMLGSLAVVSTLWLEALLGMLPPELQPPP